MMLQQQRCRLGSGRFDEVRGARRPRPRSESELLQFLVLQGIVVEHEVLQQVWQVVEEMGGEHDLDLPAC